MAETENQLATAFTAKLAGLNTTSQVRAHAAMCASAPSLGRHRTPQYSFRST